MKVTRIRCTCCLAEHKVYGKLKGWVCECGGDKYEVIGYG
jgi:hypothetical protein